MRIIQGVLGMLALGLLASIPGDTDTVGLFAGGGVQLLIAQAVGVLAIGAWTAGTCFVLFYLLKKTIGLRVSAAEEQAGLDLGEHGTVAYPDIHSLPEAEPVMIKAAAAPSVSAE